MLLIYFTILLVSMAAGWLLRGRKRLIRRADKLTTGTVWLLLAVLGVWVGSDPTIMNNLPALSGQAGVLCIAAMLGSIAALSVVRALTARRPKHDT